MTSYGKNWDGSQIQVDAIVTRNDSKELEQDLTSMKISGYHDKETSEIFVHKMKLNSKAEIGDGLKIDVHLLGGVTFKITGMAICSQ